MQTITKVYDRYLQAQNAVKELEAAGIPSSEISLLANKTVSERHDDVEDASPAGTGAAIGAVAGGAAGLLTGLGLMAIPGIGPVVAAGWFATTALGALAGGATGGIVGALVDAGVSEDHAQVYSEAVRRGGTLLSVKTSDGQASRVHAILDRHQPIDPALRSDEYRKSGWNTFDPQAEAFDADATRDDRDDRNDRIRRAS